MTDIKDKIKKYLKLYESNHKVSFDNNNVTLDKFFLYLNQKAHINHTFLDAPARAQWEVTDRCNLNCKQCYYNSSPTITEGELNTLEAKDLLKRLKKLNILWIEVQGGEPFLRDDIIEIIKYAKKINLNLKILTNGTLLTKKVARELAELLDNDIDSLQVSLDGSSTQVNDEIRGEGSFKRIIQGIKNCSESDLSLSVNTTLMNENISDCVNIYKLISKFKNVSRYTFFTLMQVGRGKNLKFDPENGLDVAIKLKKIEKSNQSSPKVSGFLGYLQKLPKYTEVVKELYGKKINFINRNTAGISSIDIDSTGDVYPSSYLQFDELKAGNIKDKSINKLWHNNKWNQLREFSSHLYNKCRVCDKKEYCGYGTIIESYIDCRKFNKQNINCNFMTKLKSERLELRPPEKQDYDFLKNLWENGKVMKYVGFPNGLKQRDSKIWSWIDDWSSNDKLRLVVVDKETGKPIGETGYRIDNDYPFSKDKTAALDIKLIPEYWGKGMATETLKMIIPYIFNETDTKIIQVTPNIDNDGALRLYNKLNFKKVGDLVTYKTKAASIECQYMELKKKDFNNFKLNKK